MNALITRRLIVIGLSFATILLALIPVFQTLQKGEYRGILPAYVDDDLYYYGRIKEVKDGYPLIGNPYFFERRHTGAASFFITDWLATLPLFFGVSFSVAMITNFIVWSLVVVLGVYFLCRALTLPPLYSAGVGLLAYAEVYWVVLRPVVMQQVFPFFLAFLFALILWFREPLRKRSVVLLALVCATAFYLYMFLWQIFFATLAIVFLHLLFQKRWPEVRSLLKVALGTILGALPILAYTMYQASTSYYWETVRRVGLVTTHMPSIDAYYYGRWIVLVLGLFILIQRWLLRNSRQLHEFQFVIRTVVYSGLGLLGVMVSNVVTGQDIATASHIGRFATLWVAVFFGIGAWILWRSREGISLISLHKKISIFVLLFLCAAFLGSNFKRSLPFERIKSMDSARIQAYAEPLRWIDMHEDNPVVIWANDDISIHIPIVTKHYVLWHPLGGLHVMPTEEVENRYLASRFMPSTPEQLLMEHRLFEGAGIEAQHVARVAQEKLRCAIGMRCVVPPSIRAMIGEEKIMSLVNRQKELRRDLLKVLRQYQVSYLVADISKQEHIFFGAIPGSVEIWRNNSFVIYGLR